MPCNLCGLGSIVRNSLIPARGQLRKPKLYFVGIAPGPNEDDQGRCFVGQSGELLQGVLHELQIPDTEVAFDNLVHCYPNDWGQLRDPTDEEVLNCAPFLYRMIAAADPDVIIPLGTIPLRWILGNRNAFITDLHGTYLEIEIYGKVRKVVPTFHPASAVRQKWHRGPGTRRSQIVNDIAYAWEHANNVFYLPKWRIINDTNEAIVYLEDVVARYKRQEIDFVALDTETPQLILDLKERRELGIELISRDLWQKDKKVVGFSISFISPEVRDFRDVEGVYVAMDHPESLTDYFAVSNTLRWALDEEGENRVPVSFHNAKYDQQWCYEKLGFMCTHYHDTMLGSFVYFGGQRTHGLGYATHTLLKYEIFKDDTEERLAAMPADQRSFRNIPLSSLGRRGAIDAAGTASLTVLEKQLIKSSHQEMIMGLMNDASTVFAEMELRGATIDYEKHQEHMASYPRKMQGVRDVVEQLSMVQLYINDRKTLWTPDKRGRLRKPDQKFKFNPLSPDHRYDLLYRYYNFPSTFAEETGSSTPEVKIFSTNENSRHLMTIHLRDEKYNGTCSCRCHVPGWDLLAKSSVIGESPDTIIDVRDWSYHHPMFYAQYQIDPHKEGLEFLLNLRMFSKLYKVYNGYMKKVVDYFRPDEWNKRHDIPDNLKVISFNYILHWTRTGRLSTRDWAIHTEPWHSDVRRLHVSRWKNDGGVLLSADYSQLELRVAAAIAKDEKLIKVYEEGRDVHRFTASKVYKLPEDLITQAMRRYSKTMSFRLIYGGGAKSIADETGLTIEEAQKMLDSFLAEFDGIDQSIKNFHDHVRKFGYCVTPMNRKFWLPDIYSDDREKQSGALRDSQNYPIQSSSSDLTMSAICVVRKRLRAAMMRSYIWAMIHDAIESDLYPGELLRYYNTLKQAMEQEVRQMYDWICVPLVAEFELGVRWDGALTVKAMDQEHMIVKGRRGFYEELMDHMARAYKFDVSVKKETLVGQHKDCGGDIELPYYTCSKCKNQVKMPEEHDLGETLILRKSYEGDSGGNTDVVAEVVWREKLLT